MDAVDLGEPEAVRVERWGRSKVRYSGSGVEDPGVVWALGKTGALGRSKVAAKVKENQKPDMRAR
jgi:hypothetical protein